MLENKIKDLIIEKYGSIRQFSIKIGLPYTTIDSILKRGIDNSNVSNVIKMCKALNISIDKSLEQQELMTLDFDNGTLVDVDCETIQIPVLGTIKAGIAIEAQEDILEYVDIPKEWIKGGKIFYGLKISGDSMFPKYNESDIVIFEHTQDYILAQNKDCAVMVNGFDATFKNVTITENGITLVPLNLNNSDNYQPTFYSREQIASLPVKIVGIAREKRTRL
jgi:repressor LexA